MKQEQERIQKLRSEIEEHRYNYHVLDQPTISDGAYDALVKELERLEAEHPQLRDPNSPTMRVGAEPLERFRSVAHARPMLSLNDAFSESELDSWTKRVHKLLGYEPEYHLGIKMDGLAASLVYEKGELNLGLTRGNGVTGEDITFNLRTIQSVPLKLRRGQSENLYQSRVEIRGEVLIYKDDFAKLNSQREQAGQALYANPRNLAAGSVRQLDPKLAAARPLRFHAYRLILDEPLSTLKAEEDLMRDLGFIVNFQHETGASLSKIKQFIAKWEEKRFDLPFHTDGVVISVNNNQDFAKLGVVGKAPRGALAYKYPAEQATTIVKDIQVNVGRTGAVTPFAVLEPRLIAGTTVQMATLHNEGEIKRKDIRIGDSVIVHKAGDIIPEVVQSLPKLRDGSEKQFTMPKKCPNCQTPLTNELEAATAGAVWRCPNKHCPAQRQGQIEHFASRDAFDIEGLGERIVTVLIKEGLIKDPADLFNLRSEDIKDIDRFGVKSAENLVTAIAQRKSVPLDRFIFGLGIRHVGRQTAIDLAEAFKDLELLRQASVAELESVDGIGSVVAKSIATWFADTDNQQLIDKLSAVGVAAKKPKKTGSSLAGKTFVLTGTLNELSRDEAAAAIRNQGGSVTSSVSANTDYLVLGDKPGSNKVNDAAKHQTVQLDEDKFLQLLRQSSS